MMISNEAAKTELKDAEEPSPLPIGIYEEV